MSPDINSVSWSGWKSLLFHGTMKAESDHRVPEFPCHQDKRTREYNANIHSVCMRIHPSKCASLAHPIHLGKKEIALHLALQNWQLIVWKNYLCHVKRAI